MKQTNTIPVYDLNTLSRSGEGTSLHENIMTLSFTDYLRVQHKVNIPHRHNYYYVRLITKGGGMQTIDSEKFQIRPAQIYFMIPGQVHSCYYTNDLDGYSVNFSESIFHSIILQPNYLERFAFLRGVPGDSVIDLNEKALDEASFFLKLIVNEINNHDRFSTEMVCFALMSLFISVSRNMVLPISKQLPRQKQMTLYNFRKLVSKHYAEKRLPKEYAAMLAITSNHLNALCVEHLGISAGKFIRNKILLEAERLLVNTDLSVTEIANKLGFNDSSYFTKFFKKYAVVTPEEFKKRQL